MAHAHTPTLCATAVALLAHVGLPSPASAETYVVDTTADSIDVNPGDGIAADKNGLCSIRAGVMEASASNNSSMDTIVIPAGVYHLTLLGDNEYQGLTGDLNASGGPLTIQGAGADITVLDGGHATSILQNQAATTVRHLTIANGGAAVGSGIFLSGESFIMEDCVLRGCAGPVALWQSGSFESLTIRRCRIEDNQGSGLFLGYSDTLLEDCTIAGNHAVIGGGMRISGLSWVLTTLNRCTISGNTASYDGGGAYIESPSNVVFTNCTISGNSSPNTGGIARNAYNGAATTIMESCTVTANQGGGIGGIFDQYLSARNSVFAGNSANSVMDVYILHSLGHNLIGVSQYVQLSGDTEGNVLDVDPKLGPLASNGGHTQTHALGAGSPAVDAADVADFPSTDQRGVQRPGDGNGDGTFAPDIGAYEIFDFVDCNANGLPDESEIAAAPALDADGTGILDECEARGDLNGDAVVNGADLGALLGAWGPCPIPGACPGDLTGDGVVDGADLGALLSNWS